MNEFTLVDFCLIPLSKTCSFDVPTKNLKDGFISIVFDVSLLCRLFDQALVDASELANGLIVLKKDDRNKKTSHLIL